MYKNEKISKVILLQIGTSVCNLKCRYCYLTKRNEFCFGKQIEYNYSPEYVGKAFSKKRFGGPCFINVCAEGETLIAKDIDKYLYEIVKQGHFIEIVTNLTVTPVLEKILSWDSEMISRVTFKCSFHYLQLKERGWLDVFASNVNKIWKKNCSANIEITPDDELIPYIEEVKSFSIEHFGALPHLTIARDDSENHDYLTKLSIEEYSRIWGQFDSDFWRFKKSIFNKKIQEYCYAGKWMVHVDIATGKTRQCYESYYNQNIYEDISKPIDFVAIRKCPESHCYNGHALITLGVVPNLTDVRYGNIRDRIKTDGTHWIQERMRNFLNTTLIESNAISTNKEKRKDHRKTSVERRSIFFGKIKRKLFGK